MIQKLLELIRSLFNPHAAPASRSHAPPAPSQGGGGTSPSEPPVTNNSEVLEETMTTPYLMTGQTKLLLQVKKDLDRHEGFREYAYPDPLSKLHKKHPHLRWGFRPAREIAPEGTDFNDGKPWTVGYGFTHGVGPDSRIAKVTAERKLEELILEENDKLAFALPWYKDETSFVTKTILVNMAFQMGLAGLLKFVNTLKYVKNKQYSNAASNMRQSLWAKQTPSRASELARRMETQEIPEPYKAPERL